MNNKISQFEINLMRTNLLNEKKQRQQLLNKIRSLEMQNEALTKEVETLKTHSETKKGKGK